MDITKKKSPKNLCPKCAGTLVLKRDAILSYPLNGKKVGKPLLKRKEIAELDNNWLECEDCGEMSSYTWGKGGCEQLQEIYNKLKW